MTTFQQLTRTTGFYHVLKAVIYRDLLIWFRYPIDAVLGILGNVFVFGMIFYGGRLITAQAINNTIEGLIVGYFLWTLSFGAYSGITNEIRAEASWGTLERHYITPFGFGPVVFAKAVAIIFRTFLTSSVILGVMLLMTETHLDIHFLTVLPVALLAITSALGLGFAMSGLSVLYKRISNLVNILQFALIGLISAPIFDLWWTKFLPLVQGSKLLQKAMTSGIYIWEFDPVALAILLGTAAFYLGIGYVTFSLTTKRARHLGTFGDY